MQAAITSITTPALQAVVPSLVESHQLSRANAIAQMASNAARLLGSPLPTLISALVISFVGAIAQGLFLALFVLFVLRSLHAGDQVVGLLRGVQAIGGVLGGLVVGAWAKHFGARALTIGGLALFGLVSLLAWNSPLVTTETWWYAVLFIAVGIPATALLTGLLTGTQRASPPRVLGRALSLIQVAQALGQGTGILAAGLLSSSASLTLLLNAQAGCYLACAVVAITGFASIAPPTPAETPATAPTTNRTRDRDRRKSASADTHPAVVESRLGRD